jgi:twitching motility protein PilI
MSAPVQGNPMAVLQMMQESALRYARGLPLQIDAKKIWVGIGFRLRDLNLVSDLNEIREVLTYPDVTRVPGATTWVKGISNVRGNLLPVLDLGGHLGYGETVLTADTRVLVVELENLFAGLLVDGVSGLRHFVADEDRGDCAPDSYASVSGYLDGGFTRDKQCWGLFSMRRLVRAPAFMQVA